LLALRVFLRERLRSPGFWLVLLAFLLGLLGAWYLWLPREPSFTSGRDEFKPELVVIQLNDTYRVDAVGDGKLGGLGRVVTLVRQIREQGKRVLVVHAGDFIAPSLESKIFRGQQMVDALNYLDRQAPLYVVPGNHEFDEAEPAMVVDAIERSNFHWLASNLKLDPRGRTMRKQIAPHVIRPVGKLRLGIFALTLHGDHKGGDQPYAPVKFEEKYLVNDHTWEAMRSEVPENIAAALVQLKNKEHQRRPDFLAALKQATGIGDEESLSALADYASVGYVGIAEREIKQLEKNGANVIIGLTHLDMPNDRQIAQLRHRHPSFVWIAGGHEHYSQRERLSGGTALITKGDSNARSIWRISIGFKDGTPAIREEKIDLNDKSFMPDEGYQRDIVADYRAQLKQKMAYIDQVIGSSESIGAECLDGTEETVRNEASNWGIFLADQMRRAYGNEEAQIGILHGGAIRIDDRFCGNIRFEHLERTFGFPTEIVYIKLSGEDLRQYILEHAVGGKRGDGRFLQVAGMKFNFNRRLMTGKRVFNIWVQNGARWEALDDHTIYSVAVPKYLYDCNDNYKFREKITAFIPTPGPDLRMLVYHALKRAYAGSKSATSDAVANTTEAPEYITSPTPVTGVWTPAVGHNVCPQ
jgi:2',3'-cyclic-nucleotide 2'-phosphodiesterase (5'-nucleotidase family)